MPVSTEAVDGAARAVDQPAGPRRGPGLAGVLGFLWPAVEYLLGRASVVYWSQDVRQGHLRWDRIGLRLQ